MDDELASVHDETRGLAREFRRRVQEAIARLDRLVEQLKAIAVDR